MFEVIFAAVYFGGVAILAGMIVCAGTRGRFGGWSNDDWPVFALTVPWVWPLLMPLVSFGRLYEWYTRRTCRIPFCARRWTHDVYTHSGGMGWAPSLLKAHPWAAPLGSAPLPVGPSAAAVRRGTVEDD